MKVRAPGAGGAGLVEVLCRGADAVAAVVADALVGDEPRHRDDPARRVAHARVARVLPLQVDLQVKWDD